MSGYLSHLVDRTLAVSPQIQPMIPTRFAPGPEVLPDLPPEPTALRQVGAGGDSGPIGGRARVPQRMRTAQPEVETAPVSGMSATEDAEAERHPQGAAAGRTMAMERRGGLPAQQTGMKGPSSGAPTGPRARGSIAARAAAMDAAVPRVQAAEHAAREREGVEGLTGSGDADADRERVSRVAETMAEQPAVRRRTQTSGAAPTAGPDVSAESARPPRRAQGEVRGDSGVERAAESTGADQREAELRAQGETWAERARSGSEPARRASASEVERAMESSPIEEERGQRTESETSGAGPGAARAVKSAIAAVWEANRVEADQANVDREPAVVRVHIGRIEVRGPAAKSPPIGPVAAPRASAFQLSTYLEQRRRRS